VVLGEAGHVGCNEDHRPGVAGEQRRQLGGAPRDERLAPLPCAPRPRQRALAQDMA
jgi:hypothetical protein